MAARALPHADSITRDDAIARLRDALAAITDEESCVCKVAAERGIFCHGFARFDDDELHRRYWWIVRKNPGIKREDLELLANAWQLAQQDVKQLPTSCDVQTRDHDTCRGWHDFTNEQIAGFLQQITGEAVRIG